MATTATAIITAAYQRLGVLPLGAPLPADLGATGLEVLNDVVSQLRTESLIVTTVDRTIFPIVANQQTYSIGTGGDFDVPRPTQIEGAALLLNGLSAAQSITIARVANLATATLAGHSVTVGSPVYIHGATETAYNGVQTVSAVTSTTFSWPVFGSPATPATGAPTMQTYNGNPIEIPRPVITDSAYQLLQIKTQPSNQFTDVYYNPTYPLGTIYLYPNPTTSDNQLVLYLQNVFDGFATLSQSYDWPSVPGYTMLLKLELALYLCDVLGKEAPPLLAPQAARAKYLVKRQNYKLIDLAQDLAITHSARYGYNINTGQGGN